MREVKDVGQEAQHAGGGGKVEGGKAGGKAAENEGDCGECGSGGRKVESVRQRRLFLLDAIYRA